ncbi:hypothetical protein AB0346_09930 [Nocardia beijingensis]|uniref:hypothetical protein n=1 Tax=Nocardia beijingensis TaxID=95162 RepID=UPI00344EBD27
MNASRQLRRLLFGDPGWITAPLTGLALIVAVAFSAGCSSGTNGSGPSDSARSLPADPPAAANCAGAALDHRDIHNHDMGTVRIFLVRRPGNLNKFAGCIAAVTDAGRVLTTVDIEIYENELHFADPVTDSTGNVFVIYNPGRYNGVLVLVPGKDGFADIGWSDPEFHYGGGRLAYYSARLVGPGGDGRYTIVETANSCEPTCAEGANTRKVLHWNGSEYLPAQ